MDPDPQQQISIAVNREVVWVLALDQPLEVLHRLLEALVQHLETNTEDDLIIISLIFLTIISLKFRSINSMGMEAYWAFLVANNYSSLNK